MSTRYLTTGQVADMLSVKSDTVLKWIRSGLLPARRTAGGHHRINQDDLSHLEQVLNISSKRTSPQIELARPSVQYCWQYYSNNGTNDQCTDCAVYAMRAQRCYEVVRHLPKSEIPKTFCRKTCEDCDYYDLVHEQNTNILFVTRDKTLAEKMVEGAEIAGVNLQIADGGYSCSLLVADFRPDYAVIDCAIGQDVKDISNNLAVDPRIPNVRIILVGNKCDFPKECDRKIFARVKRPSRLFEIVNLIDSKNEKTA